MRVAIVLAFFLLQNVAWAHRVNVFAFIDGDEIQVECSFSKSQKVKNGKIAVTDLETDELLLEGVTDESGRFRFRPPETFLRAGHGLNIRLYAGEGHQSDWKMPAAEVHALAPDTAPPPVQPRAAPVRTQPESADLEAMLDRMLERKLAPIREAIARQETSGPNLRDIIGGIGWILGLLGLATYMKYRR